MPRASVLAILVSLVGTHAAAQRCRGLESFQRRPIQLFTNGLFSHQARSYAAGVDVGAGRAFGELQFGGIEIDAWDASAATLGGGAGYQLPLNERGTAQLCPTAELGFVRGPKDILWTGIDYSETDFSFGVAAGVLATGTSQQVEVVPTGSIALANASSKLTGASRTVSHSQWFGTVSLGVGFVFRQEVSITPTLSHAFGVSGTSTTVGIRVAFAFGGARTSDIANPATSCAGLASTDSAVYDTTQVTERPRVRSAPEPRYPPMERGLGREGQVILAVVIGPDGAPDLNSLRIVDNLGPAFDREALRWIWSASYWPACRDGRPVRARVAQPVDFCAFGCRRR